MRDVIYNPLDWYWLADDGRTYASGRQKIVKKTDAAYKEWIAAGNVATRWPVDDLGQQTDAALYEVLQPYGLGAAAIPTITPRQLRLWLLSKSLLAQVPELINAMPEPDKSVAQIEWEFATVFDHTHPFIQALGAAVGLSSDDIVSGFREAALL